MNPTAEADGPTGEYGDTSAFGVIAPGTVVSHYSIVKKIGAGGMGEVYLAEDTKLQRKVALKFLLGEYTGDEEFKTRFMREAQAAAALAHPNIITIHEVAEYDGRPYIAMEYVEGRSLKELIAGHDLSVREIIDLAIQVGEGLHKAHEAGIVHRDVKPQNILIDNDGRPKITDFGLAMLKGVPKLTRAGTTFGTMAYISPEQAQGIEVDRRADIFSFGVVLYLMITGRLPFSGDNEATIINAIINQIPEPLARFKAGVPDALQLVVKKALVKNRDERYQHMDDLVADLKRERRALEFADSSKTFIVAPPARPRRRLLPIIIPAAVVAVIALLVFVLEPFRVEVGPEKEAMAEENLLAVMYFENLADREDPNLLGEIVTELLITDLSGSQYVNVVSSQRLYDILKLLGREGTKTIDRSVASEVAVKAGARWMLQGSILQMEPQITLTSQMVEVESGKVLASQRITGEEGADIFSIVDKLTVEIKKGLALPAQADTEAEIPIADMTTSSPQAYRHYLEGLDEFRKLYYAEAARSFKKALEYDSTFAMAYYQLALMAPGAEQLGYLAKAVQYSDHATEKDRHYIRGIQAITSGDVERGIAEIKDIVERFPQEKEAHYWLGVIYRDVDPTRRTTIEYLEKAVELDPLYKEPYNMLAYSYSEVGDVEKALWAINRYIELAPDEPNPYDSRAELYGMDGKLDQAIDSYARAIEIKPDFYYSVMRRGHMYMFKGEYEKAEQDYRRLASSDEREWRARGRLVLAYVPLYQGRFKEGLEVLDNGIAADVMESSDGTQLARKHYLKAQVYGELGDLDAAIEEVKKANEIGLAAQPNNPTQSRHYLAYLLARAGRLEDASRELEELKVDVEATGFEVAMANYWIARGLFDLATEEYDSSVAHIERATAILAAPPTDLHYMLGRAYLGAGMLGDAVAKFEMVASTYNSNRLSEPIWAVDVHYFLGLAYERSGWDDKAAEQYEEFLRIWEHADPGLTKVEAARR